MGAAGVDVPFDAALLTPGPWGCPLATSCWSIAAAAAVFAAAGAGLAAGAASAAWSFGVSLAGAAFSEAGSVAELVSDFGSLQPAWMSTTKKPR